MILRFCWIAGTLLVALAWVLTVPLTPSDEQVSSASMIDQYREAGHVPGAGALAMSASVPHETFEEPEEDLVRLEAAFAEAGGGMPGMQMPGMTMPEMPAGEPEGEPQAEGGMAMSEAQPQEAEHEMPGMAAGGDEVVPGENMAAPVMPEMEMPEKAMPEMEMPEMAMPGGEAGPDSGGGMAAPEGGMEMGGAAMPGMAAGPAPDEHEMEEEEGFLGKMDVGLRVLAQAPAGELPAKDVAAARSVELEMREWGYTPASITVQPGERLRLVVRNAGTTPHEFMIMPGAAMQAVSYRVARADWSLTEHEALNEIPVMMPGDVYEVVVEVDRPGMWMFMCMFPYHMKLGMMGSLATEGMQGMGGMKM